MQRRYNFDRQTELKNCDFVKIVLMLLVVLYHCMVFWTGEWMAEAPVHSSWGLSMVSKWLNSFHIYGFVLVSGYLFYYLKYEKERYPNVGSFVANKAKRLLVPYLSISIAWVIPLSFFFDRYSFGDLVNKFVLGTAPAQLWFLLMLFVVFALFYPLSDFFAANTIRGGAVVLVAYAVGVLWTSVLPNVFQIATAMRCLTFFWMGFKLRQYGTEKIRKIPWWGWLLGDILLYVTVSWLQSETSILWKLTSLGLTFVLRCIGALGAFFVLQKLAQCLSWEENRCFVFLKKRTMPIFLLHQQVIYYSIFLFNGAVHPYIHVVINYVSAMIVSLLVTMLMMRFPLTRFLIGEK